MFEFYTVWNLIYVIPVTHMSKPVTLLGLG